MKDMAKYIITVISDFWVSKFAQYTIQKTAPGGMFVTLTADPDHDQSIGAEMIPYGITR